LTKHRRFDKKNHPERDFQHCSARIDGLVKQEETPTEMTQSFMGRDDYLYYRHVTFGTRTKKFGPTQQVNYRPIVVSYHEKNPYYSG
jgi:hypothetical protein